jgi:hypothetical protein
LAREKRKRKTMVLRLQHAEVDRYVAEREQHDRDIFSNAFDTIDDDGSGFVEASEVLGTLKRLGRQPEEKHFWTMFREFANDSNDSGRMGSDITKEGFVHMMMQLTQDQRERAKHLLLAQLLPNVQEAIRQSERNGEADIRRARTRTLLRAKEQMVAEQIAKQKQREEKKKELEKMMAAKIKELEEEGEEEGEEHLAAAKLPPGVVNDVRRGGFSQASAPKPGALLAAQQRQQQQMQQEQQSSSSRRAAAAAAGAQQEEEEEDSGDQKPDQVRPRAQRLKQGNTFSMSDYHAANLGNKPPTAQQSAKDSRLSKLKR